MIQYVFSTEAQAKLISGLLIQVVNSSGQLLPILRDPVTGQFVEIAKAVASNSSQPLVTPVNAMLQAVGMVQTHMGFQKTYKVLDEGFQVTQQMIGQLQSSVGVLQSTTALIGVGTVAGVALSAANLYQTLKLREEVQQMRLEIKDGFLDLKKALTQQGQEILNQINFVAADVEFRQHRTILVIAYSDFVHALDWLQGALKLPDPYARSAAIVGAQGMLFKSLAAYNSPEILQHNNAAGLLRRRECAWGIDQAITMTYQCQGAYDVASDRLSKLQSEIKKDLMNVVDHCQSEVELDFLYPELSRIHEQDLAVLGLWQGQASWLAELPSAEQETMLFDLESSALVSQAKPTEENVSIVEPPEQVLYQSMKAKSHYQALRDTLRFKLNPSFRQQYQDYITQMASQSELKALVPANWQEIPDLAVANLYWYLRED
jgi:hypothetical protein